MFRGWLNTFAAAVVNVVRVVKGFFRQRRADFADGFHTRRDGRVVYHGRNTVERFTRTGWGTRKQRMGPPKLTGDRLLKNISHCNGIPLRVLRKLNEAGYPGGAQ